MPLDWTNSPQPRTPPSGVTINTYRVIYNLIDDVKAAMEGKLRQVEERVPMGSAKVKAVFGSGKKRVAGCEVRGRRVGRGAGMPGSGIGGWAGRGVGRGGPGALQGHHLGMLFLRGGARRLHNQFQDPLDKHRTLPPSPPPPPPGAGGQAGQGQHCGDQARQGGGPQGRA